VQINFRKEEIAPEVPKWRRRGAQEQLRREFVELFENKLIETPVRA
jgi:phage terminase small subunit